MRFFLKLKNLLTLKNSWMLIANDNLYIFNLKVQPGNVRFLFDGERLSENQTPQQVINFYLA